MTYDISGENTLKFGLLRFYFVLIHKERINVNKPIDSVSKLTQTALQSDNNVHKRCMGSI